MTRMLRCWPGGPQSAGYSKRSAVRAQLLHPEVRGLSVPQPTDGRSNPTSNSTCTSRCYLVCVCLHRSGTCQC